MIKLIVSSCYIISVDNNFFAAKNLSLNNTKGIKKFIKFTFYRSRITKQSFLLAYNCARKGF